MTLLLIVLFVLLLAMGAPVAVGLGLSSAVVIVVYDLPVSVLAQRAVNALDSTPLLAVPLFIFAATLLSTTGITNHLMELMRLLVGRVRGGLAQVNILVSLVFSGISGAALADIGALGKIQMDMMVDQGYTKRYAAGITVASATIGPIFPPSIPLIIFAAAAEISAVKLLLAGAVPALIITAVQMIQVAIQARVQKLPRDDVKPTFRALARSVVVSTPALIAPIILVGGLMSGYFGPTEVGGVTVAYAILIGIFIYRELTWKRFVAAALETVESTANILFIVASAALFAWVLTIDGVPAAAGEWLLGISDNPLVLLIILNVLLLIVGMFLESIAAILIIAPIVAPAMIAAGVDPIQLGVVFVLNLMIGLLTPPVGMSLYVMSIVAKMPFHEVVRGTAPFYIPLFLSLALVTLFPLLSTWLPDLFIN